MSSENFIIWLKGFVEAANPYNITPQQFETIKEVLKTVVLDKKQILND